jgi:hypothetical protein
VTHEAHSMFDAFQWGTVNVMMFDASLWGSLGGSLTDSKENLVKGHMEKKALKKKISP